MADKIKQIQVGDTTYDIEATTMGEAKLTWGGKNFSGSYGPIDAAMIDNLGANRAQFIRSDGVVIQYSTNGGSSWVDYGASATQKIGLFSNISQSFVVGKATSSAPATASSKLRIFINTSAASIYTALNKFAIYLNTNGSTGCTCSIDARLQSNYESGTETWTNFANKVSVAGWSGWNIINTSSITTYGNTKTSQYGQIRFTFEITGGSTSYAGLTVCKIMCFGGVGWTTPSTMASTGLLYSYDTSQNATFPAAVKATSLYENGTTLSSKYLGVSAKAADSDKLDGHDSSYFASSSSVDSKIEAAIGAAISDNY